MYGIMVTVTISASHSLLDHPKCSRMHGHNYTIKVFIVSEKLQDGMIADFGVVKKKIKDLLMKYDHKHLGVLPKGWQGNPEHIVTLPFEKTSAENLAQFWATEIQEALQPLQVKRVEVWESQTSMAYYEFQ